MSLFTKRKGRRISSFEDDDEPTTPGSSAPPGDEGSSEPAVTPIRFGKRPQRRSTLRRSINIADPDSLGTDPRDTATDATTDDAPKPQAEADGRSNDGSSANAADEEPAVVRPSMLGRSSSRRRKNRLLTASTSSRLSFGGGSLAGGGGDDDDDGDDDNNNTPAVVTPSKRDKTAGGGGASLTQRVLETNALRKALSSRLPTRQRTDYDDSDDSDAGKKNKRKQNTDHATGDDDDDNGRPRYSQAYLDELQNSTPNTPVNLAAMQRQEERGRGRRDVVVDDDADLMDLDPSELDGAMLVDSSELVSVRDGDRDRDRDAAKGVGFVLPPPPPPIATVLTETEIQERKDRRARHAREQEFISLSGGGSDDDQSGYISILTDEQKRKRREKESTRLVREDEDLGEGFDEFVEDKHAPLALGKNAEREARRRRKQEMADLISAAAGGRSHIGINGDDDSDDSEAERQAAYDAAQTRAGMDGLPRTNISNGLADDDDDDADGVVHGGVRIPKMPSALPDLAACLQQMQSALNELELSVARHRHKLAEVDREKAEITGRETEVQAILDAAAAKYQAVLGGGGGGGGGRGAKADGGGGSGGASGDAGPAAAPAPAFNPFASMRSSLGPGQSPLRPLPPGLAGEMIPVERGLESLGTTPTRRPHADDYF